MCSFSVGLLQKHVPEVTKCGCWNCKPWTFVLLADMMIGTWSILQILTRSSTCFRFKFVYGKVSKFQLNFGVILHILNLFYNNRTSCNCAQSILFHCIVTLHISDAFHTHHQEYINCIYSLRLMYSWWWVCKAPETCRETLQWNTIDCAQLHLVGLL